jgi:hypothetical protein
MEMKRVKSVRPAPPRWLDAAALVDQLVALRIEEDRLHALLERIRDRRSDAMALLVSRAWEKPKTGKKRREDR